MLLAIGRRDSITPKQRQGLYLVTGIYCQLGDNMLPTVDG